MNAYCSILNASSRGPPTTRPNHRVRADWGRPQLHEVCMPSTPRLWNEWENLLAARRIGAAVPQIEFACITNRPCHIVMPVWPSCHISITVHVIWLWQICCKVKLLVSLDKARWRLIQYVNALNNLNIKIQFISESLCHLYPYTSSSSSKLFLIVRTLFVYRNLLKQSDNFFTLPSRKFHPVVVTTTATATISSPASFQSPEHVRALALYISSSASCH